MMRQPVARLAAAGARALWSLCGAFSAATLCWMVWGFVTPGDDFGNGGSWLWLSLIATGIAGGYAAFKVRSTKSRALLSIVTLVCAIFWFGAPTGWWVKPPPAPAQHGGRADD